jgi:serine/threonine-protein kinase
MEFVEGESLSQLLKRASKLSVENALKVVHQTAQGLATAHDKGVVHRDIKPGNLMLTPRGQVKIADFGIALATSDFSKKLTSTGEFVGTPGYLSPEVCLGKQVDQRSDIFSLGIVLYEMLSGDTPFHDESPLGLMLEVVKSEIPDIRALNSEVDQQTAEILKRMLAKDPADRFQSCHELVAALEAHALVARGGTIKLPVARPAASDATVVGAPTPASQPQRIPTPPPRVSTPAPQGVAAVPPPVPVADYATRASAGGAARPSVLERSQRSSSPLLPLAIVAVLVLALVGGAFAFRGPLMDFAGGFVDGFTGSREAGEVAGKASNPLGSSVAAEPAGTDAAPLAQSPAGSGTDPTAATDASAAAGAADPPAETAPAGTLAEGGAARTAGAAHAGGAAASGTDGLDTRLASAEQARGGGVVERIAERREARRELAAATEPRRVAPPRTPRIAVVALGDNALTTPAEQRIESALMRAGFDLVDESLIGYLGDDPASVLAGLRGEAEVLVLVRAEAIGSQELTYYGQSSTLYSAYLGVRAFAIEGKRPLGPGIRTKVDFTTLNAQEKAMEVVEPGIAGLVSELGPYRARGRG